MKFNQLYKVVEWWGCEMVLNSSNCSCQRHDPVLDPCIFACLVELLTSLISLVFG